MLVVLHAKLTLAYFIPISRFTEWPMVLIVNDQQPYKTLEDFIDDAKKRPNELVFSSSGLYGALHLPTALLMKAAAIQMKHLPTNGGGPALTALLGNNAQVLVSAIAPASAQLKAGKVRALACFSPKRAASLPDVPTLKELGYDRVLAVGWPVCAERHPGCGCHQATRGNQQGRCHGTIRKRDRDYRRCGGVSRSAGFCQVLGRGCRARRGCGAHDRQGLGQGAACPEPFADRSGRQEAILVPPPPPGNRTQLGPRGGSRCEFALNIPAGTTDAWQGSSPSARSAKWRSRHHLPVLGIEAQGSCLASDSPFCSSSME